MVVCGRNCVVLTTCTKKFGRDVTAVQERSLSYPLVLSNISHETCRGEVVLYGAAKCDGMRREECGIVVDVVYVLWLGMRFDTVQTPHDYEAS
jgi:hypothetical protein